MPPSPTPSTTPPSTLRRLYPPDSRNAGPFDHTVPDMDAVYVKATGQTSFKFGRCMGISFRVSPDGQKITFWQACIGDGLETAFIVTSQDRWTWTDWHKVSDDHAERARLDDLDAAKVVVAESKPEPLKKAAPAPDALRAPA